MTTPSTETAIVHSVTGSVPESEDVDEEFDESVDYDAMFVGEHVEITDEEEAADEGDEEEDDDEDEDGEEDGDEDEEEDVAEEGHAVGSKRKLKSVVWVDFKKVRVRGRWKAQCLHCKKKLGGESKNGTKHLHVHLASCTMKKVHSNGKTLSQSSLRFSSSSQGKVSVENYNFNQVFARKMLASMIVLHEYPLSIVDHTGFRRFVSALQPLFTMVTRNTIRYVLCNCEFFY